LIKDVKERELFDLLLSNSFIISSDINEIEQFKFESNIVKYLNQGVYLTIAPTLDCNMACPYCFEQKKKMYMNKDVQDKIIKFLEAYYEFKNFSNLHITWYGGEPLLGLDAIYYLSEKLISFCAKKNINYTSSMITNGVLLTRDVAQKLSNEYKVKVVQITIDGLPEYHNIRRILIDGSKSFDTIINNIENCKDLMQITVRVNVDKKNKDNLDKLTDYFINEKGWINNPTFYLAPVVEKHHV